MAESNDTETFAERVEDAYQRLLHIDSLIAVFKHTDWSEVQEGNSIYAFEVVERQMDDVCGLVDRIAFDMRKGGAA